MTQNKRLLLSLSFIICHLSFSVALAQTSRTELRAHLDLASGNYCNYPNPTGHVTPAPDGYEPFYVSHYGRHGARYMTDNDAYKYAIAKMDTAKTLGLLTPYGEDVLQRLNIAYEDAKMRAGDLTPLGGRQHRAIAHRLCVNYPSLMNQAITVKANSSTVRRCMISMANFCQELLIMNPKLDIKMDASEHDMYYIIPNDSIQIPESETDGPLYEKLDKFRHEMLNGRHQFQMLFTDPERAGEFIDHYKFTNGLWNIAADMDCLPELKLSFKDLFTDDEYIDGFRAYNASWCLWEGLMPGSQHNYYAIYPLLKNFLDEAELMVASGKSGVRLRFGHDSVVLPFSFILGVKEAIQGTDDMENLHNHFAIFRLIPMAGNVQMIFFRKQGSDDVLVKFLMNENETSVPIATDCYPFYHWKDVDAYYRNMLEKANITYKTIIEKEEDDEDD